MIELTLNFLNYINLLIDNNFFIALFIYTIATFLFFTFSLPGGPIVILSSGFFFGFYLGFIINIFSAVFGSLIFFIFVKFFFTKFFIKYLDKHLEKINNLIKNSSFEYLILFRLVFGVPLIIQNIFLSTLYISKTKFVISSAVGFTPFFIFVTYAGHKISNLIQIRDFNILNIFSKEFIIIIILLVLYILFRIYYKNSSK